MLYQHPVTPSDICQTLSEMCSEIAPSATPFYVDVAPILGAPINECFSLVECYVRQHGGTRVIGWSLWEMPGLFVEAEFHAIWRSPEGSYLDIAPKMEATARILFLPSPDVIYSGRLVDNIRRPIGNDPKVIQYLRCFNDLFEFRNRVQKAGQHGEIELKGADQAELKTIQFRMASAHQAIAHRFPNHGPYLPCWCGSGKKMKWCHKK